MDDGNYEDSAVKGVEFVGRADVDWGVSCKDSGWVEVFRRAYLLIDARRFWCVRGTCDFCRKISTYSRSWISRYCTDSFRSPSSSATRVKNKSNIFLGWRIWHHHSL